MKHSPSPAVLRVIQAATVCLVAAILFLTTIRFGVAPDSNSLDASWLTVNAWAFANDIQLGTELAFTYGPWAIVHPLTGWTEASYETFLIAMPAFAALTAIAVAWSAWRMRPTAVLLLLIVVILLGSELLGDGGWLLAMTMCIALVSTMVSNDSDVQYQSHYSTASADTFAIILVSVFLAWLSQVKFSLFLAVPLIVVGSSLALLLSGRRRQALILVIAYPCVFLALWLAANQKLSGLPLYFRNGLDTSIQYGAAMPTSIGLGIDIAGSALLLTVGAMLLIRLYGQYRLPGQAILTILVGGVVYLGWRAGFTRADQGHVVFFCAAVCGAAIYLARSPGWLARIAVVGLVPAALALHLTVLEKTPPQVMSRSIGQAQQNLARLQDPELARSGHRHYLESWQALNPFDQSRALIGESCMDIVGVQQAVATNTGMNYCPRPVFQTYAAYSERLTRLNEAYYIDARHAPDFVLAKLQPIDGRLASSEDPLTLAALLRAYRPVGYENDFLIMQRGDDNIEPIPTPDASQWTDISLGEWIDVPDLPANPTLAHIRVEPSLIGRIYNLVMREQALFVELDTAGTIVRYRVPRSTLSAGFVINPLIQQTLDILGAYMENASQSVTRLRLVTANESGERWFKNQASIAFSTLAMTSSAESPGNVTSPLLPYPGFSRPPTSLDSPAIKPIVVDGQLALFAHAPARMDFELPASQFELRLRTGILASIASAQECAGADGITLRAEVDGELLAAAEIPVHANDTETPLNNVLKVAWTSDHPHSLSVFIDDNKDSRCDWSYIKELSIIEPAIQLSSD